MIKGIFMNRKNLVEFSELVEHATTLGYDWNTACDFLDDMRPQYEIHKLELEASEFVKNTEHPEKNEYSDEVYHVMSTFFTENKVKSITVINS